MPSFETCRRWLIVVGMALIVFGMAMAAASSTPVFDIFHRLIDPAFWGSETPPGAAREFQGWVYGIWGSTIAGWGIAVVFIAREAFARRERWAWQALAFGTGLWFLLDTGLSLAHGVWFNVAFNCGVALAVAVPLASAHGEFQ